MDGLLSNHQIGPMSLFITQTSFYIDLTAFRPTVRRSIAGSASHAARADAPGIFSGRVLSMRARRRERKYSTGSDCSWQSLLIGARMAAAGRTGSSGPVTPPSAKSVAATRIRWGTARWRRQTAHPRAENAGRGRAHRVITSAGGSLGRSDRRRQWCLELSDEQGTRCAGTFSCWSCNGSTGGPAETFTAGGSPAWHNPPSSTPP
jgi:hypothetical protein